MNTTLPLAPKTNPGLAGEPHLIADWEDMVFVHFRIPAAILAPEIPLPLLTFDGWAYVSLVTFKFTHFRSNVLPDLTRLLFRPVSEHPFLNFRTYVLGPKGPGIFFISEWITNRLSAYLGPLTYGLPYHLADFERAPTRGGIEDLEVTDATLHRTTRLRLATHIDSLAEAEPDTLAEFLLERYTAYTHRDGALRYFRVGHEPWKFCEIDCVRADLSLLLETYPWFHAAEFACAHRTRGVFNVGMSLPGRC